MNPLQMATPYSIGPVGWAVLMLPNFWSVRAMRIQWLEIKMAILVLTWLLRLGS